MDAETNIEELKEEVREFCEERDWDQFHDAKELAVAVFSKLHLQFVWTQKL
jgi:translation elongation factor EF-1beta